VATNSYQRLRVWQQAIELVAERYQTTRLRLREETWGLISQVWRAAVSIPTNIAEGQGRGGKNEAQRFAAIANGSLYELETHLVIARRLDYLEAPTYDTLNKRLAEVGRLLPCLMRSPRPPEDEPTAETSRPA
jgi:four helix bundle protein